MVTITHTNLPGVSYEVTVEAYRLVWYPEGWRSIDDPDWAGADGIALAGDLTDEATTRGNADNALDARLDVVEPKVGFLTITQAVDLDAMEIRVLDLDAAVVLRGSWDASAGTFPGGGTAQAGASYIVSVAGTVGGVAFNIGDRAIAITDNASTTVYANNWFKADYTDQVLSVDGRTGAVTLGDLYAPVGEPVAAAHIADGSAAHAASAVSVNSATLSGTGTDVQAVLEELDNFDESLREIQVGAGLGSDVSVPGVQTITRAGVEIQVFDASGTYTKPAGATAIQVIAIGGGGGGGSGRKGAAGAARYGGGGGRAGLVSEVWLDPASVGTTETVTIGAGGTAGAAQATDTTDGSAGGAGGTTTFGSLVTASGGNQGFPGTAITGGGGGGPLASFVSKRGSFRNSFGADSSVAATPTSADGGHTGSGGAGGGIDTSNVARAGGNSSGGSGGGGATGGAVGTSGATGGAGTGSAGGGGGSGGGAASGTVGAGAAGAAPGGGGGGGGAGINATTNSGAGGVGGAGRVVVLTYR